MQSHHELMGCVMGFKTDSKNTIENHVLGYVAGGNGEIRRPSIHAGYTTLSFLVPPFVPPFVSQFNLNMF